MNSEIVSKILEDYQIAATVYTVCSVYEGYESDVVASFLTEAEAGLFVSILLSAGYEESMFSKLKITQIQVYAQIEGDRE